MSHEADRMSKSKDLRMNRSVAAPVVIFALAWSCIHALPAAAQPELRNPKITFDYYEPRDPKFAPLYQRLQDRRVLEELSKFLAPVKWPNTLRLVIKECPASSAAPQQPQVFYTGNDRSLTICYQWFAFLEALRPQPAFGTRQEVVVGGLLGIVLRESARAVFDMLQVPLLGDEGDAADQASAFTALQFDDEIARVTIKGSYFVWKKYDDELTVDDKPYNFSTRSSLPRQRMYNTLCIAYGSGRTLFKTFVDQGDLISTRAETCADEYRLVQAAFRRTIVPHVDLEAMKKVQSTKWLEPGDLRH